MELDDVTRWKVWDLFLRMGTAEISDAGISGVELVPSYPAKAVGASRLAIGRLLRFAADKREPEGPNPVEVISATVRPGDILAVASNGAEHAIMGGRLAARAIVSGAVGVVTDGRLRDANELGRLPIAAWASAATPSGGTEPGSYRVVTGSSKLFGLEWSEGDWYAQDEDGALRLTESALAEVIDAFGRDFSK